MSLGSATSPYPSDARTVRGRRLTTGFPCRKGVVSASGARRVLTTTRGPSTFQGLATSNARSRRRLDSPKRRTSARGSQVVRAVRVQVARRRDQPQPQEVRGLQGDRRRPQDSAPQKLFLGPTKYSLYEFAIQHISAEICCIANSFDPKYHSWGAEPRTHVVEPL